MGVGVEVLVGVGVLVGSGVLVSVGVLVGASVLVGAMVVVGVTVGLIDCPGPQAEMSEPVINKQIATMCFEFISPPPSLVAG